MWTIRRSAKTGKVAIMNYFLTGVKFPEGSVIVDADKVFKYESWAPGPSSSRPPSSTRQRRVRTHVGFR